MGPRWAAAGLPGQSAEASVENFGARPNWVCTYGKDRTVCSGPATIHGVEAVVDKDLTASLLAAELNSDCLLLLTDVPGVYADWPDPRGNPIETVSPETLLGHSFAPGSMSPKVEAACRFVELTGKTAAIGALRDAPAVLRGDAGTQIRCTDEE